MVGYLSTRELTAELSQLPTDRCPSWMCPDQMLTPMREAGSHGKAAAPEAQGGHIQARV